ncbi:alpha/beta hydrolase [Streptomyces sp. WMMC897]|uniref:alpha/beta hydrolase n=1 Tax=Streptomyces sp. WMMC897 TaxID=3014782 RepID=UPI0022B6F1F4|nr:alpha/beta hydrolase [Streptomyces sp. WMMC897]MCZ7416341.1 alpha/beta hydrolase [Streptomyces sp. WMMC897]
MVTLATLRAVNPDEFEEAADGYHAVSTAASTAKDRLSNEIIAKTMPAPAEGGSDGLVGEAASAARRRLERLGENLHYTQVECGLVRATLNGFAADLRAARKKLDAALDDAAASGLTVNGDGSVSYPAAGEKADGKTPEGGTAVSYEDAAANGLADQAAHLDPNPKHAVAKDCADRIAQALKEATEADQTWAPKLRELKAQNDLTVSSKDWADVHGDREAVQEVAGVYLDEKYIPEGRPPKENAAWWNGLTPEEQADYTALYPASIGALDGIPSDVRDEANRAVLAQTKGDYETQLAAIPPKPSHGAYNQPGLSEDDTWRDRQQRIIDWEEEHGATYERLANALKGMEAIEDRFEMTGRHGIPEAYLLGFNPDGNGRAIIANGNPDEADHTAVYVPGTGSNLSKAAGNIERMTNLWRESSGLPGAGDVSTVTWIGYDAPQTIPEAMSGHYATDGAHSFNSFMEGLHTANTTESGGHHTTVGHSYGSTLVGYASTEGALRTDDMVLVGSPGLGFFNPHASDLDVPDGHVWNAEADGDKVPDLGRYVHGGYDGPFGGAKVIPSDDNFGANQLHLGNPGEDGHVSGHSDYWDTGSVSLENQALVVIGEYDRVRLKND